MTELTRVLETGHSGRSMDDLTYVKQLALLSVSTLEPRLWSFFFLHTHTVALWTTLLTISFLEWQNLWNQRKYFKNFKWKKIEFWKKSHSFFLFLFTWSIDSITGQYILVFAPWQKGGGESKYKPQGRGIKRESEGKEKRKKGKEKKGEKKRKKGKKNQKTQKFSLVTSWFPFPTKPIFFKIFEKL